ncbi:AraC family transcriptional regulator [Shewanella maritima]|uniref:AraC family transcriptional regulator n=1 Tax=Shewanella maritima TaxID=2520507 RepID=A0A411PLJ7_9GAMM|nr:AraC family transcriptional regulator [Shewanella maritima]QBF84423.1 AraC family transcriptional regulator [Shewanella maritima]
MVSHSSNNVSINNISISVAFAQTALAKVPISDDEKSNILQQCRIPSQLLMQPSARISLRQYGELITQLMLAGKDELLGHGEQILPIGNFAIMSHFMITAKNLEHVLKRLKQYNQVMGNDLSIEIEIVADECQVSLPKLDLALQSQLFVYEFGLFFIHRMLSWYSQSIIPITAIELPFAAPVHARDYALVFYGAPIKFNAPRAKLSFDKRLLVKENKRGLAALEQLLTNPIANLLMLQFHSQSYSARVGKILQSTLQAQIPEIPELPSLDKVAAKLNLAPYTLQRRLSDEGNSFIALKNQLKRDKAIELLAHSELSIEQISHYLGFAETSPFTRTFKQWTGVPPSAYRKR